MGDIKPIKTFTFVENLVCIYRNYSLYDKKAKKIILSRVIIEICIYFVVIFNDIYVIHKYFEENLCSFVLLSLYNVMFIGYSIMCIVYGVSRSDSSKELVSTLTKMHRNFNKDMSYNKWINKINFKCILAFVLYFILLTFIIIQGRLNYRFNYDLIFFDLLLHITRLITEYRYVIEYLVYALHLTMLHKILNNFNSLIEEMEKKLSEEVIADENISDQINLTIIEGWVESYRDLVKCSEAFRKCFGAQIVVAIVASVMHNIIISYHLWALLLQTDNLNLVGQNITLLFNLVFSGVCHLSALMIAITAAQRIQNKGRVLRISLARLYNVLTSYPNRPELKKIRNFCRMVSKNPVEINLFPEMVIGMALMPTCLSLGCSYVIVMLQFIDGV